MLHAVDRRILEVLHAAPLTIDQLLSLLPEFRWNELFVAIDRLSRDGTLVLRRRGFDYELSLPSAIACA